MASNSTIAITFKLDGDNKGLKALTRDMDGFKKVMTSAITEASRLDAKLLNFAAISTAVSGAQSAIGSLQSAMSEYTKAYAVQQQAEAQLEEVMRQRMSATAAEVQSIKDLASAQQQLGVIGDEVQLAGAQQVATFLTQSRSIETLLPAMNDLLAQQKGLNATTGDAVSIANLMGKAMQGQTSALTKVGITFNSAQEQIMKYGDESLRAATLAEIITDNVGHMNQKLAQTESGKIKQLQNTLGDLGEEVGRLANSAMPFLSMAAAATTAAGGVVKLIAGVRTAVTVIGSWNLKAKSMALLCKMVGVDASRSAVLVRVFSSALRGGAYSATAFKLALRGLLITTGVGAAIAAVTLILEQLINAFDRATDSTNDLLDAEKRAKRDTEALEEAQRQEETTLRSTRAALAMNISRLKEFNGTKAEEKKLVKEMNDTYGDSMGYFNSVSQWYRTLVANSEAYCRQMVIEARTRLLANQIAQKQQENYAITHNEDGSQRLYSTKRKTEVDKSQPSANTYGIPGASAEGRKRREIVGSSDAEKAQAAYDSNTASIEAMTKELDKLVREASGITYKAKGSANRQDGEDTSTTTTLTDRQKADAIDITEVMGRNRESVADFDKVLEDLRLKQKFVGQEEYAAIQKDIDAVEAERKSFIGLIGTLTEKQKADAVDVTEVMGRNKASVADYDKALEELRLKQRYSSQEEYTALQNNIDAVEAERKSFIGLIGTLTEKQKADAIDITEVMGRNKSSVADFDKVLEDLRLKQRYASEEEYAAIQKNIDAVEAERKIFIGLIGTLTEKQKADAVDVTEVMGRNKASVADYDKALEELRLKQRYSSQEEYTALQLNISAVEAERDAFTRLGRTMSEAQRAEAIDITEVMSRNIQCVADYDQAIQDLSLRQRYASEQEYKSIQENIKALQRRKEEFTSLREPVNESASTLKEISANIDTLTKDLETATIAEASLINRQIEMWNRKAEAIRKAGVRSQGTFDTLKSGWGTVKNLDGSLQSMGKTLSSNATLWEKAKAVVDGFIAICEGIGAVVQIVKTLTTVSHAHTAAKIAETAATTANTTAVGAAAAEAPVAAAAEAPLIAANKALTASFIEAAAAAYMAAHASIPFAGFAIGSAFAVSAAALVKGMGLMAFANGGIAYGPTLGLFGEYAGASSNPEVVAPLDKLKSLIEPSQTLSGLPKEITLRAQGKDLVGVLKFNTNYLKRTLG